MEVIIVGTDFSAPAQNAVNYAVGLAKYFSAKLVLVNSYPLPTGGYDNVAPMEMIGALQDGSVQGLKELKQEIIKNNYNIGIECVSQIGTPYGAIKDAIEKYSGDLIVMGMAGAGGFVKRHLIGSTAISVAKDLKIPSFIIPETAKYRKIRNICFACDADKIQEGTLLYTARDFAKIFGSELELVSVDVPGKDLVHEPAKNRSFVEKRLFGIKHKHVHIADANVSSALEYYFKFHKTDVVIVTPGKHNLLQKLFTESITKSLAFALETPMLVIH